MRLVRPPCKAGGSEWRYERERERGSYGWLNCCIKQPQVVHTYYSTNISTVHEMVWSVCVCVQDAHVVVPDFDDSTFLLAVFDGHGGGCVTVVCSVGVGVWVCVWVCGCVCGCGCGCVRERERESVSIRWRNMYSYILYIHRL